jgi:predicted negative regulator of RcsB-dependent stress response
MNNVANLGDADLANLVQNGMKQFVQSRLANSHEPQRWKGLLWDIAVTPQPPHDHYADANWPAWRLLRHALGKIGHLPQHRSRALVLGFPDENAYDVAVTRYRDAFRRFVYNAHSLADVATEVATRLRRVVQALRPDPWQDFIQLLTPLLDWESELANKVQALLSTDGRFLLLAYYPHGYARLLAPIGSRLKQTIASRNPHLGVFVASPWEESLCEQFHRWSQLQEWGTNRQRLVILPLLSAADFPDLSSAMDNAAVHGVHVLAFCPDADSADATGRSAGGHVCLEEVVLAPWFPSPASAGYTGLAQLSQDVAQAALIFEALACFSALHRRPTVAWLEAITGVPDNTIRSVAGQAPDFIQRDRATHRLYWSSQDGSVEFLESQSPDQVPGKYADMIWRLCAKEPPGWERAVLNLLKSMYQTGRLRLLRRVLAELRRQNLSPENLLERFPPTQRPQARLDLARVYARARLYQEAHDLLLEANVAPVSPEFLDHQLLCAEILTEQVADTGKILFFEAAQFIYGDLAKQAVTNASRQQELDERKAELFLAAGGPREALQVLNGLRELSLFGRALKARALAESGQFAQAAKVATAAGQRWRSVQLQPLPGETPGAYDTRWSNHVQQLLHQPASQTPVEALHQAAIRALERGHFDTAHKLLEHATGHYRDNVHLAVARARLLVETGQPDEAVRLLLSVEEELTGQDNIVVQGALYDALLEEFRKRRDAMSNDWRQRLERMPQPIFDRNFRKEHYLPSQLVRLLTLEAKAFWYGALTQSGDRDAMPAVVDSLRETKNPAALNLAARILATREAWTDALQKVDHALKAAPDPQSRIRTLNTKARILLDCAAAGASCGFDPLKGADQALQVSEGLDAGNTYTMLLRAEWLERSGDRNRAAQVRNQAEALRRIEP